MSNNLKKRGGYFSYGIAEYNSKRNLRPKQIIEPSLNAQVDVAKIEIHRMNPLRNHKKLGKQTRYFLRSVYGSKY